MRLVAADRLHDLRQLLPLLRGARPKPAFQLRAFLRPQPNSIASGIIPMLNHAASAPIVHFRLTHFRYRVLGCFSVNRRSNQACQAFRIRLCKSERNGQHLGGAGKVRQGAGGTFEAGHVFRGGDERGAALPGEGEFPIREYVAAVRDAGYEGPWGVEVLSQKLRALPIEQIFDSAAETTRAQLG